MEASKIAIIGMSCRVPGAADVNEFWQNLCAGVESIRRLSADEMLAAGATAESLEDPHHVPFGALLEDIDKFDAAFFGITAREAELMDPQQRVFLEAAWQALEHAGHDPMKSESSVAVFGGINFNSYLSCNLLPAGVLEDKSAVLQTVLANDKDYLATRVSYRLNLRGPAYTVQSGCSTSLVAVHLACRSLLSYECDVALAGAAAIDVDRGRGYFSHEGSVFSPDGHCRAFDAGAKGTVFGNGVGIVVLKRLEDALRDGNTVYGVVLGSAVNNDGSIKVGFTAPSVVGQSEVIAEALADAGVPADSIGYVEAHGTGTPLGDPIEIEALTKAFGKKGAARCAIGSVKTNIGHLDAAAGIAGLIKTVLALRHRLLPPSLHFSEASDKIDFAKGPFYVNTSLKPWESGTARRAGVSSFGMGGTNAHIVLEEAAEPQPAPPARRCEVLVWSARTAAALDDATRNLSSFLRSRPHVELADVAFTLQTGRTPFAHRRAVACCGIDDAIAALEAPERIRTQQYSGETRPVAFLFGSQSVGMAGDLYDSEPEFRKHIELCRADYREETGRDLMDVVRGASALPQQNDTEADSLMDAAQFAVQYALAQLWMSWGVKPTALFGRDRAEYVAACIAGVFSRRDALRLVARRAALLRRPPHAVATAAGDRQPYGLEPQDLQQFTGAFAGMRIAEPSIPFVSNVTGRSIDPDEATNPHYWVEQHRRTLSVEDGLRCLTERNVFHLIEMGPGGMLADAANQQVAADDLGVITGPALNGSISEQGLLDMLGQLWCAGVSVDWNAVHGQKRRRRVPLPTYPFERQRFWIDPPEEDEDEPQTANVAAAAKRADTGSWFYAPTWKQLPPSDLMSIAPSSAGAARTGPWLVLADDTALSASIVETLKRSVSAEHVVVVKPGDRFKRVDSREYRLNPAGADEFIKLAAALDADGRRPACVANLWTLSCGGFTDMTTEAIDRANDYGFHACLRLVQALEGLEAAGRLVFKLITANAQDVLGTEQLSVAAMTPHALARVIPQERPHVQFTCVDVDGAHMTGHQLGALATRVVAELTANSTPRFVALRGNSRWTPTFEPIEISRPDHTPLVRRRGTYIILGGLGRIGLTLAEHLASTASARLVLVGRSGLPPREEWGDWLTREDESHAVCRRIRQVEKLESLGSDVLVLRADIGSRDDMAGVVQTAEAQFGAIDGVIAAAGVVDAASFKPVLSLTKDDCDRQFRAKVEGMLALESALADRPLDFCLIVSSLSSVLGGLGYGAYAAASVFMDGFVRHHNRHHQTRWLSVNWDAWRWGDVPADARVGSLPRLAMSASEGMDVFDRVLMLSRADQVAVSTSDLSARVALWVDGVAARADGDQPERKAAVAVAAPRRSDLTSTQQVVVDIWCQVLGTDRVELNESFLDLGGTSLTAVQTISKLESALGIHVAIEEFIFQTAGQLAALCDQKLDALASATAAAPAVQRSGGALFRTLREVIGRR